MKGFRGQVTHLASTRMFQPIAIKAGSHAFVNASLHLTRYLQKSFLAAAACHSFAEGGFDLGEGSSAKAIRFGTPKELKGCRRLVLSLQQDGFHLPAEMAAVRGRTGERAGAPGFTSLPQISVHYLVSLYLSSPSVNSSFENLFLQPHLEITVLSHFIEILNIQKVMRFSDDG